MQLMEEENRISDSEQENKFEGEDDFFRRIHHSCSNSPTEKYQNKRINSEIHHLSKINKHRFSRTASLDFNSHNAAVLSPQFLIGSATNLMKSPCSQNYQKGWNSERVQLHMNRRKQIPSKWEDAERWIGSPVSIDENGRLILPSYHVRQSKSKIGSTVPCFDSGRVVNMASNSPFLAGVLVDNPQCYVSDNMESVNGWSDLSSQSTTRGEKHDSKEGSIMCSPGVISRDMATQMSPSESTHSSPKERLLSVVDPIVDVEAHFSELEIRDVEVDNQFTTMRRQKKHTTSNRCLRNIIEWKNITEEDITSCGVIDPMDDRHEAKIGAWTNLHEEKSEEAIQKIELKIEKERCSSMDKILNKLRFTQKKAEDMRSRISSSKSNQNRRISKNSSLVSTSGHLSFIKSCFVCRAS